MLEDRGDALMVRAELPAIPAADRALADVQAGKLAGFSIEFRALEERHEGGLRVVTRADLDGVGLVGAPSYEQSTVELRGRMGRTMRARIPAKTQVACRCSGVGCRMAEIAEGMDEMFREVWEDFQREAVAGFGNYSESPLASVSSGTLRGRVLRSGDGEVEIDLPDSPTGAAVIAAHEAAGVIVRPHLDADSEGEQRGDTMVYTRPRLRGILVSATDAREGWPEPELIATPDEFLTTPPKRRARRLWL